MTIKTHIADIPNSTLAHLAACANLGVAAALHRDGGSSDSDYEAACRTASAYRTEIQRRTQALTDARDQAGLDALNAAIAAADTNNTADRLRILKNTVAMMLAGWGLAPAATAEEGLLAIVRHVDHLVGLNSTAIADHDADRQKREAKPCVSRSLLKLLSPDSFQELIALMNADGLIMMSDRNSAFVDFVEAPDRHMTQEELRDADDAEVEHQADLRSSARKGR